MTMKKILINASNLHVGGGVQVASSFLIELMNMRENGQYAHLDISVIASSEVLKNVDTLNHDLTSLKEVNIYGLNLSKRRELNKLFSQFDIILTVFGPFYFKSKAQQITGFAQPWIAYPDNFVYQQLPFLNRIKTKLAYKFKNFFFKKSQILIVEAEHVKKALVAQGYPAEIITVVPNAVSAVYDIPENWKPIQYTKSASYTLGFIGRNYFHKNLNRLKDVNEKLKNKYGITCDFLFTLTPEEMAENGFDKLGNFQTVGSIAVDQCPAFYQSIDALIFPSLLECFSATPIEAMKMGKLVIASKLPFVTDICKNTARYFDPLDNNSIAEAIYLASTQEEENKLLIDRAKLLVQNLPTSEDRAKAYLNLLDSI